MMNTAITVWARMAGASWGANDKILLGLHTILTLALASIAIVMSVRGDLSTYKVYNHKAPLIY